jgi:hypothetical protein
VSTHPSLAAPNLAPDRSSVPPSPLRLELKPPVPAVGWVDGVWWPRSTDLIDELPALLTAVAARIGTVVLVGYHLNAWKAAPAHMKSGARSVALQGFTSEDPHSVVVVGTGGLRLTLTVIPPQTTNAAAANAFEQIGKAHPGAPYPRDNAAAEETDRSLDEVATRLTRVDGSGGPERAARIAQWVSDAAEQFVDAPVQAYVPILVEHIVRQKLGPPQDARLTLDVGK